VLNTTADANSVVQLFVDEFHADCLRLSARPSLSRNRWNTASSVRPRLVRTMRWSSEQTVRYGRRYGIMAMLNLAPIACTRKNVTVTPSPLVRICVGG
jgi:hypothetical protein